MSSPMRPGTEGLTPDRHWHVFKGIEGRNGHISLYREVRLSFLTRAAANQWARLIEFKEVKQCKGPFPCTIRVFDPNEVGTAGRSCRLTQQFVDRVVSRANKYADGSNNLVLAVYERATGEITRTWVVRARLLGYPREIRLGSAEVLTLEEARVVAAKVMPEFVERRRLLKEGEDGNETHAAFLGRMEQLAVEVAGLNATT